MRFQFATALLSLVLLTACTVEPKRQEPDAGALETTDRRVTVAADSYPVYYFASRIAGDHADIQLPVPRGADPAYWRPQRSDLDVFQTADLVVLNGAGLAQWISTVTLPEGRIVDTASAFEDDHIVVEGDTHSHGPEGEHTHYGTDSNTWLDPVLATQQADAIWEALVPLLPGQEDALNSNVEALKADLHALDVRLRALSESLSGTPVFASHPVYDYLARRYAWNLKSMHWEPDDAPDEAGWEAFDALRQEHPAPVMLWEDDPHPATAALLAERNVAAAVFRTCANRPPTEDYIREMNANIDRLEAAMQ